MSEIEIKNWKQDGSNCRIVATVSKYSPFYIKFKKIKDDGKEVKESWLTSVEEIPTEVFKFHNIFNEMVLKEASNVDIKQAVEI